MPTVEERLTADFLRWEARGRGWRIWEYPVPPEPLFWVFPGHGVIPPPPVADDGKQPTLISSFIRRVSDRLIGVKVREEESRRNRPEPDLVSREGLVEIQAFVPSKLHFGREEYIAFLTSISSCRDPVAFEIIGEPGQIGAQFAASPDDVPIVRRQLESFFPDVVFIPASALLETAWGEVGHGHVAVVEFGLGREFMLPLARSKIDPFVALIGALSELQEDELGVFQVLVSPVRHPWASSIIRSVSTDDDKPFFVNAPELYKGAQEKVSQPLYAAVVRIATRSDNFDRSWDIARNVAAALGVVGSMSGNELVPLSNDGYPQRDHVEDVLCRQSRRSGMILNADELTNLVHFPSADVRSPKLLRHTKKTKAAPAIVCNDDGLLLGHNIHHGVRVPVTLPREARKRHTHLIGASGTGKSTLLLNLISQDIQNGEGVAVMDPHGDLIDRILSIIPENRIDDVVLVDPSDKEFSVGFNILFAHSELEKTLLASDLVAIFQRAASAWGDQLESVLRYAILAFLESEEGGSLTDLRRFLLEADFRESFLNSVRDPDIVYYWRKGFKQLSGNKSVGSVLTRLEMFLSHKAIKRMVSQKANRLDFGHILDSGKIFLAKLSQGMIGQENSYLLGSLLVAKFQQLAMARAEQEEASRRDFFFYVDEFSNFLCPSMAEILSGTRKYGLALTLAHHELQQLERDKNVASAVLSNCYTRICFRVGDQDAPALSKGFSSFEPADLQNLPTGEAIVRVERRDFDFNLNVELPPRKDEREGAERRARVVAASRAKYSTPHKDIERAPSYEREIEKPKVDPPISTPKTPPPKQVQVETELGRGGAQHQAIQKRFKEGAEALGYRAIIEKQILDGAGSVDVLFERDGQAIACEITITSTIDQEVGNVAKCIKAGIEHIAVVAISDDKLEKLKAAISNSLGADKAGRVGYYLPDAFLAHLKELPPPAAAAPQPISTEKRNRGYKVKRSFVPLSPGEAKEREAAALKLIAEAMRPKQ